MIELLYVGAIAVFALSSGYFFIRRDYFDSDWPWLVSFITIISYTLMLGLFNTTGEPVLYTRWLGYALSCTLLTASLLAVFGVAGRDYLTALIMTPLIMLTGFLASMLSADLVSAGLIFVLGCIPFWRLIAILRRHQTATTALIMNYLYFGWLGFPVVFVLSPELLDLVPDLTLILGAYLLLDIVTKIVFYHSLARVKP